MFSLLPTFLYKGLLMSISSNVIKNNILGYYRFKKQWEYVATELYDCDVIVSNTRDLHEIEVKTSWSDYNNEFKKVKHIRSKEGNVPLLYSIKPNYHYFAAPTELAHRIKEDIKKHHPFYGVFAIISNNSLQVISRAKRIHKEIVPNKILQHIAKRNSSELITLRRMLRNT